MSVFNPDLSTRDGARRAVRNGAYAAFASAAFTTLLIVLSEVGAAGPLGGLVDVWALIDVALLVALAVGTLRENRYAATALVLYFVVNQVLLRVSTGQTGGIALAIVFVLFYVQGARGAWALHRMDRDADLNADVDALAEPKADLDGAPRR